MTKNEDKIKLDWESIDKYEAAYLKYLLNRLHTEAIMFIDLAIKNENQMQLLHGRNAKSLVDDLMYFINDRLKKEGD